MKSTEPQFCAGHQIPSVLFHSSYTKLLLKITKQPSAPVTLIDESVLRKPGRDTIDPNGLSIFVYRWASRNLICATVPRKRFYQLVAGQRLHRESGNSEPIQPPRAYDIRDSDLILSLLDELTGWLLIVDTANQIKLSRTINYVISGASVFSIYRPQQTLSVPDYLPLLRIEVQVWQDLTVRKTFSLTCNETDESPRKKA